MLIILDGTNGTGKSTHACRIVELLNKGGHHNYRVLRALRNNPALHLGREDGGRVKRLRELGVPVNTFVDDIYMADFLAATGVRAVLDRSIGSAIAYGLLYKDITGWDAAQQLLSCWQEIIAKYPDPVVYIWMKAAPSTRDSRCRAASRWHPTREQDKLLDRAFNLVFQSLAIKKHIVDTSDVPDAGIDNTCRRIIGLAGCAGAKDT